MQSKKAILHQKSPTRWCLCYRMGSFCFHYYPWGSRVFRQPFCCGVRHSGNGVSCLARKQNTLGQRLNWQPASRSKTIRTWNKALISTLHAVIYIKIWVNFVFEMSLNRALRMLEPTTSTSGFVCIRKIISKHETTLVELLLYTLFCNANFHFYSWKNVS